MYPLSSRLSRNAPAINGCAVFSTGSSSRIKSSGNASQEIAIVDSCGAVEIGVATITLTPCCEDFSNLLSSHYN